ncbi:MAG: hypothetical protein ACR2JP_06620 [Acidimicrobiia bacterium]
MRPESEPGDDLALTVVAIGDEAQPVLPTGSYLADRLASVRTPLVLLTGVTPPGEDEVVAMFGLFQPGGTVALALPVTDALKTVEDDRITGTVDRSSVVALRLPVLAATASVLDIAETAGGSRIDLVAALAAIGPVNAFVRTEGTEAAAV